MMSGLLSILPSAFWIIPIIFGMFVVLVWYALSRKEDVSALFLHGKTVFRLEAKGDRRKR
jgi:lipid-A-disaccharide synthase-like uncharacterized protein